MKRKNDRVTLLSRDTASPATAPKPDEKSAVQVFAYNARVGMKEFYESAAVGMLPVLKVTVWAAEYAEQIFVRSRDATYKVLRAYDDKGAREVELTCEEAVL